MAAASAQANAQHQRQRRAKYKQQKDHQPDAPPVDDAVEVEVRRLLPPSAPRRPNDVYITRRTHPHAQLKRVEKLLANGHKEINVHGLGDAINRAITIATRVRERAMGNVDVETTTSTVKCTDALEPLLNELGNVQGAATTRERSVPAVHIRIFRPKQVLPTGSV